MMSFRTCGSSHLILSEKCDLLTNFRAKTSFNIQKFQISKATVDCSTQMSTWKLDSRRPFGQLTVPFFLFFLFLFPQKNHQQGIKMLIGLSPIDRRATYEWCIFSGGNLVAW